MLVSEVKQKTISHEIVTRTRRAPVLSSDDVGGVHTVHTQLTLSDDPMIGRPHLLI